VSTPMEKNALPAAAPSMRALGTPDSDSLRSCLKRFASRVVSPEVLLVLMVAAVYWPVATFQFLNWDDPWYLTWNNLIKSWHPASLYQVFTEPVARNYAPLTIFSYLVEHTLWGLDPAGYHLTNVVIHAINTVLVLRLVRQLTGHALLSVVLAGLFALHPVQVESVAWISSRKTLLSTTMMLASFECWLRPCRTDRQEGWGLLWLLLGLLCKASVVVVPPIVIAYDVLVARKRLSASLARQVFPIFFCTLLILGTMQAQVTIIGGLRGHLGMSKLQLFGVNLTLLWRYVWMLIWPDRLCVLYDPPTQGIGHLIALSGLAWTVVVAICWRIRHCAPLITWAALSAFLLMVPMLNLFPLTTLMNDRYLYLTCVPVFGVLFAGLSQLLQAVTRLLFRSNETWLPNVWNVAAAGAVPVLLASAAWGTLNYLPTWRDPVLLWSHARDEVPQLVTVQVQWALTMEEAGHPAEAAAALHTALRHGHPDEADRQRIRKILDRVEPQSRQTSTRLQSLLRTSG